MAAPTYIVYNSAMATTAAPVVQTTGTAIRTMLQIKPAKNIRLIEWGCSFNGTTIAAPGTVELIETGVIGATVTTGFAAADIQLYGSSNGFTAISGDPLTIGTTSSGFATTSGTEGSIVASRMADVQQLSNVASYVKQWPLGREFEVVSGNFLRVRTTFASGSVGMICYVIFEV